MSKKEYKLKIKTEKNTLTNTYGKFILQPLERGYGVTVGNALRRVLLTSLPGAAITNVKVEGVLHEFSTISGVKEDMADIIQNLKSVRFKLSDSDVDSVKLALKGKKVLVYVQKIYYLQKPNSTYLHIIIQGYKDCSLDVKKLKKTISNYKINYIINW